MGRRRFERELRSRHNLKDPDYVSHLWELFGADYDNAGENEEFRDELFAIIDDHVNSYRFGQSNKERTNKQRYERGGSEGIQEATLTIQPRPGTKERARAEAVSEYVAKVASADTLTVRYRERVLGRSLSADEARRFLSSPVAASVSISIVPRAKPRRVSFLDYEIGEQAEEDGDPCRVLRYSYAGRERETRLRPLLRAPGREDFLLFAGDEISPDEWWQEIPDQDASVLLLPTRFDYSVVAESNSALDLLASQANKVAHRYLLEPTEAAWLILTGEPPKPRYMSASLSSLSNDHLSCAVLTLTIEPWVSPDKVKSYYQEIRQSVLDDAGCKHRTVEVFRFVVAHTDVEEIHLKRKPRWTYLCDQWNERYPEGDRWYFSDYRDFRRSYIRGRDSIAFPLAK